MKKTYPNGSKKAVCFTFDDGRKESDEKVIRLLKLYGMKATFNLIPDRLKEGKEVLQARYAGFDIANHTKYHPYPLPNFPQEGKGPFQGVDEKGAPISLIARDEECYLAEEEAYRKCMDAGKAELEEIFERPMRQFVWPGPGFGPYEALEKHVKENYDIVRRIYASPNIHDEAFSLPTDWQDWAYNANHTNVLDRAKVYEKFSSENLSWICIGVHPREFYEEGAQSLEAAMEILGGKPQEYWYATIEEMADYLKA